MERLPDGIVSPRKRWLHFVAYGILSLTLLVFILVTCIPSFVSTYVIPPLLAKFKLENVSVEIQDVGFTSLAIGPIQIGSKERRVPVTFENIRVHYQPVQLLKNYLFSEPFVLDALEISGLSAMMSYTDKGFALECSEWEALQKMMRASDTEKIESKTSSSPRVEIQTVRIDRVNIFFKYHERMYWIFAKCNLETPFTSPHMKGDVFTQNHRLHFEVSPTDISTAWRVNVDARANLADFKNYIPSPYTGNIEGNAQLKSEFILNTAHKNLVTHLQAEGKIKGLKLSVRKERTPLLAMTYRPEETINFQFSGDPQSLSVTLDSVFTQIPVQTQSRMALKLALQDSSHVTIYGSESTEFLGKNRLFPQLKVDSGISFFAQFQGNVNIQTGAYHLQTALACTPRGRIEYAPCAVQFLHPILTTLEISSEGRDSSPVLFSHTQIPSFDATLPNLVFHSDSVQIVGTMHDFNVMNFSLMAPETLTRMNSDIVVKSKVAADLSFPLSTLSAQKPLETVLSFSGNMVHPLFSVDSFNINVPFIYPFEDPLRADSQTFSAEKLVFEHRNYGSLSGTLEQRGLVYHLVGSMRTSKYDLPLNIDVVSGMMSTNGVSHFGTRTEVTFPQKRLPENMNLGYFHKLLDGYEFDGELALNATYPIGIPLARPEVKITLDSGNLTTPDKATLKGIRTQLYITSDESQKWMTPSAQTIQVADLQIKTFSAQNLNARFRLEHSGEFLLEAIAMDMCGGSVSSLNSTLRASDSVYNLMLYCDRLRLSDLLKQLNVASVASMEGDVLISGLIPLSLEGMRPHFGKGYLYTSPNVEGILKLYTAKEYTQSLPMGSPGFLQLELSRAALESFKYKWIKLDLGMTTDALDSTREQYRISLSIFGRPTHPLPFTVNARGDLVQLQPGSQGKGFLQDMQIDLNFNADVELLDFVFGINNFLNHLKEKATQKKK